MHQLMLLSYTTAHILLRVLFNIVCIVCLYNIGKVLIICSNDVELNPGSVVYKTSPNCGNETVHTKKKVCPCDHIFRKTSSNNI